MTAAPPYGRCEAPGCPRSGPRWLLRTRWVCARCLREAEDEIARQVERGDVRGTMRLLGGGKRKKG